jgi:hypothetical protein
MDTIMPITAMPVTALTDDQLIVLNSGAGHVLELGGTYTRDDLIVELKQRLQRSNPRRVKEADRRKNGCLSISGEGFVFQDCRGLVQPCTYVVQCGGMSCDERTLRGISIDSETVAGKWLPKRFDDSTFHEHVCWGGVIGRLKDATVAAVVLGLMDQELSSQIRPGIVVDRDRAEDITEACIPVLVDGQKAWFVYENCD